MGMAKSIATAPLLLTAFGVTSCISTQESLPPIPITSGSELVRVIEKNGQLPADCVFVTHVQAEDGIVSNSRLHYTGTRERAIQRIRNSAIYYHANTVALTQELESLELPGRGTGYVVSLYGTAYKCSQ